MRVTVVVIAWRVCVCVGDGGCVVHVVDSFGCVTGCGGGCIGDDGGGGGGCGGGYGGGGVLRCNVVLSV